MRYWFGVLLCLGLAAGCAWRQWQAAGILSIPELVIGFLTGLAVAAPMKGGNGND